VREKERRKCLVDGVETREYGGSGYRHTRLVYGLSDWKYRKHVTKHNSAYGVGFCKRVSFWFPKFSELLNNNFRPTLVKPETEEASVIMSFIC
jgi:hypothetical protein